MRMTVPGRTKTMMKKRKHDRHAHLELLIEGNIYVGINWASSFSITSHYIKQHEKETRGKKFDK